MTGNSSAGTSNGRKGRGVSWRLQETLNLLEIWGEQKIQDQLRNSHQNIDFFEYIAQKMATRGHRRTALECRSKTKVMRLEYKRVIDHNSKAGSSKVTCPFYEQLHHILQGNASMKPSRVGRTLSFHLVPQPEAAQEQPQPAVEETIPPDVHVVNVGEYLKQEDADDTGVVTGDGTEEDMAEAGENDMAAMKEEDGNEGSGRDLDYQRPRVNQRSPIHQDAPVNTEPPVAHPPPAPSPLADFAILRPKKRKGAETLFQELLQQSREEQEELLLEMGRDREVALSLLKTLRQDAAGCREERRQIMETMRAHHEILKGLAANLNSLTDAFASPPQARTPRPGVANSAPAQRGHTRPNDENCSPRSPLRRLHSNILSSSLFPANNTHHMA
ncbi:uncharacterized protein LOC118080993 isoform X3 [Zootoca vivipara]|uniref:uncharacterized protein LOC118080993 isoform X3 n=1 Tax=Zootoca vivipara TaxID=8524 RepID=UPI00293BEEDE|nr:uncharacterized protein LOC118080993 isoform X3 [Zootoca vivipara]